MDFVTNLSVLTNRKNKSYDFILVIVDYLTKMIYYMPVKVTIDTPDLTETSINIVVY